MKTPEELWSEYHKKVYPGGISGSQEAQLHAAFTAAMLATVCEIRNIVDENGIDDAAESLGVFVDKITNEALTIINHNKRN